LKADMIPQVEMYSKLLRGFVLLSSPFSTSSLSLPPAIGKKILNQKGIFFLF